MRILFLLLFTSVSICGIAQEAKPKYEKLDAVFLRAEIIGVLNGRSNLAVIQIKKVPKDNKYHFKTRDELLVDLAYMFTEESGKAIRLNVTKGDVIEAEILGRLQPQTGQYEYFVMRAFMSEAQGESASLKDDSPPE